MNKEDLYPPLQETEASSCQAGELWHRVGKRFSGALVYLVLLLNASLPSQNLSVAEEQQEMVETLHRLGNEGGPMANYHWNSRRARVHKQKLEFASGNDRLRIGYQYNCECLKTGDGTFKEVAKGRGLGESMRMSKLTPGEM